MKILTSQQEHSVLCVLPNGKLVEIAMISMIGEDVFCEPDVNEAIRILRDELGYLM